MGQTRDTIHSVVDDRVASGELRETLSRAGWTQLEIHYLLLCVSIGRERAEQEDR